MPFNVRTWTARVAVVIAVVFGTVVEFVVTDQASGTMITSMLVGGIVALVVAFLLSPVSPRRRVRYGIAAGIITGAMPILLILLFVAMCSSGGCLA